MNERIEALAKQAAEYAIEFAVKDQELYIPKLMEKFAELIVNECVTNAWVEHEAVEAEREAAMKDAERYRHAMREAMYLLDQPEPRPHAAFSELLLALNPAIDNRKKSAMRKCIQEAKGADID